MAGYLLSVVEYLFSGCVMIQSRLYDMVKNKYGVSYKAFSPKDV